MLKPLKNNNCITMILRNSYIYLLMCVATISCILLYKHVQFIEISVLVAGGSLINSSWQSTYRNSLDDDTRVGHQPSVLQHSYKRISIYSSYCDLVPYTSINSLNHPSYFSFYYIVKSIKKYIYFLSVVTFMGNKNVLILSFKASFLCGEQDIVCTCGAGKSKSQHYNYLKNK